MPTIAALLGEIFTHINFDSCVICSLQRPLLSLRLIRNLYRFDTSPLVANLPIPYDLLRRSQPGAVAYLTPCIVNGARAINGQDEPWASASTSQCLSDVIRVPGIKATIDKMAAILKITLFNMLVAEYCRSIVRCNSLHDMAFILIDLPGFRCLSNVHHALIN